MVTVSVQTGRQSFNRKIIKNLARTLAGFESVVFTDILGSSVDIVVCTPEQLSFFEGKLVLLLSDDINFFHENDNVVTLAPIPLTPTDFERLEWKLTGIIDNLLDVR